MFFKTTKEIICTFQACFMFHFDTVSNAKSIRSSTCRENRIAVWVAARYLCCIPTAVIRQIFVKQYCQWWSSFALFRRCGGRYCFLFRVTVWVRWTLEGLGSSIAFLMEELMNDLLPYNQHSVSVPGTWKAAWTEIRHLEYGVNLLLRNDVTN
jgi:hypothetical protein